MHIPDDTRLVRTILETRHGIQNDIIMDGTHYYPLSPSWQSDAWFHVSLWDPGVCHVINGLQNNETELRRLGYTTIADIISSYCHWLLVHVYLTATNPPPINAAVLRTLSAEIDYQETIWDTWRQRNRDNWTRLGSHPAIETDPHPPTNN